MVVTQKQVAEVLGLSPATVSRALAGDPRITEATRARVVEASQRLGYQPNLLAAGFRTGNTHTIGLVVMDITNPFYSELARGVEDCAFAEGFSVFLCDSDLSPERETLYLDVLRSRRVDGVLMTPISRDPQTRGVLAAAGVPYVLIDAYDAPDDASTVTVDHVKGAHLAVRHLQECGHTRIAFAGSDPKIPPIAMMLVGYRQALAEAGLRSDPAWISEETTGIDGGSAAISKFLALREPPTAALFNSDLTAFAAMRVLEERNLRIPDDFALVGYDDVPMSSLVKPTLTTIAQDKYQLGRISARILINEIRSGSSAMHQKVLLQPRLVLRDSTRCSRSERSERSAPL